MAWLSLTAAGLFEISWPLGFKLAQGQNNYSPTIWFSVSIVSMVIRGYLRFIAQKTISIGAAGAKTH